MTRKLSLRLGGLIAPWLVVSWLHAAPPAPTNVAFSQVQASTLTVDFQGLTGTTVQFLVEVSSSAFVTPLSSTTVVQTSTFTGLSVNTLYFAQVTAIDTVDLSSTSAPSISTYTWANPPLTLTTTLVSVVGVDLAWDDNDNPSGTLFSVERTSDSVTYDVIGSGTGTSFADNSVSGGVTYTYRVRALNTVNIPTAYSNTVSAVIPSVASVPRIPSGFSLTRTQIGASLFQVDFVWHAVGERTDGTTLSNLHGYKIYVSTSLLAPRSSWVNVSTPTTESWSTTTDGTVHYYAFRTVDDDGQVSDWSRVLDDSSELNHIFMGDDFTSRVTVPQSSAVKFLRANNTYVADLDITVTDVPEEATGRIARSLYYKLINYDTQTEITNPTFNFPIMQITLAYTPTGDDVSIYWFNGIEWVKTTSLGGSSGDVVTFTGARIGRFQVRAASHASGLILTRVYPRIISPNSDGWNDKVVFEFDNPSAAAMSGKIYDLSNAFVAELVPGLTPDSTLVWDGKDEGGKTVPGGIYLYQIDQDGTPASGSVVVAR